MTEKKRGTKTIFDSKGLFTSKTPEYSTPQDLFNELNKEFKFTLDPCATKKNAKCKKYYTKRDDGLSKDWYGETVFMNPPYGREIGKWVKKAAMSATTVVCLLPARTDTKWFHLYINNVAKIRFIKGRLRFGGNSIKNGCAPFPSMIVIFK